jgi:hypothetical protein
VAGGDGAGGVLKLMEIEKAAVDSLYLDPAKAPKHREWDPCRDDIFGMQKIFERLISGGFSCQLFTP